ncbi:MAG: hypothetical protein AAF802_01880 [Planctomycetota bacterium]
MNSGAELIASMTREISRTAFRSPWPKAFTSDETRSLGDVVSCVVLKKGRVEDWAVKLGVRGEESSGFEQLG